MSFPDPVAAAIVAAVPATIAAVAAWKSRNQTKTSNGHTLGQLVESIHDNMKQLIVRVDNHIDNATVHHKEVHALLSNEVNSEE